MTNEAILTRLVELEHQREAYRAALFLLKQERRELQGALRASGWKPPEVGEVSV